MTKMKGITCCGDCGYYSWKKHKCTRATDEGDARSNFYADCPLPDVVPVQEPVEPVVDIDTWKCGNCGHTLEHQQLLGDNVLFHEQYNYCPECGRPVKWK